LYLAVILDAWSRRVAGHAISRSIDARLAIAARPFQFGGAILLAVGSAGGLHQAIPAATNPAHQRR
jgi:hypothetical protein